MSTVTEETKLPVWEVMNAMRAALEECREEHGVSEDVCEVVVEVFEKYIFGE